MARPPSLGSRIRGSLFGVAVVDALGGPVEFHKRGSFPLVTGYRHNENFDLLPGTFTDDTSLTLCLAQSLVDKGFDVRDQVSKYLSWYEHGYMSATGSCFDIGNATRAALQIWKDHFTTSTTPTVDGGQALINGSLKRKVQCGNGSLMRVSPIALVYHRNPALAIQYAIRSSEVTHPYSTNSEACKIYTRLIVRALESASKEDIASDLTSYIFEDPDLRLRFEKYSDLASFQATSEQEISSSGYVVHTLEAALWAFFTTDNFERGAFKAVNLGHDSDTVGAIFGALAGAFYGFEEIPPGLVSTLEGREMVTNVAEQLANLIVRT